MDYRYTFVESEEAVLPYCSLQELQIAQAVGEAGLCLHLEVLVGHVDRHCADTGEGTDEKAVVHWRF